MPLSNEEHADTGAWIVDGITGQLAGRHAAEGVPSSGAARSLKGLCVLLHGQLALWVAQNAGTPVCFLFHPDASVLSTAMLRGG